MNNPIQFKIGDEIYFINSRNIVTVTNLRIEYINEERWILIDAKKSNGMLFTLECRETNLSDFVIDISKFTATQKEKFLLKMKLKN